MIITVLNLWLALLHPFYVSVTEITVNPRSQSAEISCRMFYDDLEKALNKQYRTRINIVKPVNKTQVNELLNNYIGKHLLIKIDGKLVKPVFIGYELQEDGAWSYLEVKGIGNARKIEIHNDLLYAEHEEQINMMHITVNGQRKSTKLDYPDTNASFAF